VLKKMCFGNFLRVIKGTAHFCDFCHKTGNIANKTYDLLKVTLNQKALRCSIVLTN
jgi:hypothetical protein